MKYHFSFFVLPLFFRSPINVSMRQGVNKTVFAWAAVVLFIFTQLLVAQHTARFGLDKHTHHGEPCQIQLFADRASASGLPAAPQLPVAILLALTVLLVCRMDFVSRAYRISAPRAPPLSIA